MSKGRNTTVVSVRLPDDIVKVLKSRSAGRSMSSYIGELLSKATQTGDSANKKKYPNLGHDSRCPCGSGKVVRKCCGLEKWK